MRNLIASCRIETTKACFAGLMLVALVLAAAPIAAAPGTFVAMVPWVTSGLTSPVGIENAHDGRLFVVQQTGQIRVVNAAGTLLATPFLDISGIVLSGGERGLLGLAFHPSYATNGFFYVFYTRQTDGAIVVARYHVSASPDVADAASALVLFTVSHSATNHNGGQIAFGPDGYLYITIGDNASGANAQNIDLFYGKVLRIDVNGDDFPADPNRNYSVPPSNPFVGATPGADEVWAYGLRNPWRLTFDRLTGNLYIGDVGEGSREEVDYQAAGLAGGRNYGWPCREGFIAGGGTCNPGDSLTDPVLDYDHSSNRRAIIGGFVFRNLPRHAMYGNYFFADLNTSEIWATVPGTWTMGSALFDLAGATNSFGEGQTGRLYVANNGTVQWLAPFSFADVPPTHAFWKFVEGIYGAAVTNGCGGDNYCPNDPTTRDQMAVFLLIAKEGAGYVPPPCTTPLFNDVPCSNPFAPWINELVRRGVTAGCGGGNYCPQSPVARDQMAVFLLTTFEGVGYTPPPCPPSAFADVPSGSSFCPWVKEIAARGITAGCGGGNYCPTQTVNRGQMSVFLSTTFGLRVP
jgi:glucose/sorbosone dehydrogenase/S-layer family protein